MQDRIDRAVELIREYGQIDGGHHKMWLVDQVLRALLPDEAAYEAFVREYENDGECEWYTGVAP